MKASESTGGGKEVASSANDSSRFPYLKYASFVILAGCLSFYLFLFTPSQVPALNKLSADESDERVLNVHIVPHTHDDVGWLKTVDQYYYGLNNSIQHANVQSILDTVVASLMKNPSRTFTYVEQKFFSMWWNEQPEPVRDSVRFLIANDQLFFVNGGWCMHDEAATHFMGMIDQTTTGHSFLKNELGVIPTVGWQLDPFGHSATQASLLTARAGFNALYFGRIDYQDLSLRHQEKACEGVWDSSQNLNGSAVFFGLTGSYGGNYGAPSGFNFGDPKQRIVGLNETSLKERVLTFLGEVAVQSNQTQGNHIMLTMGTDFMYEDAHANFANLDLLIATINVLQLWDEIDIEEIFGQKIDRVNIFYSTPEYYTRMKYRETVKSRTSGVGRAVEWPVKKDDFFPYSDGAHNFWTGYFTSRAAFKRFERVASSFLLAARQIEAMPTNAPAEVANSSQQALFPLEDALGISQHHDAVSGTAKQHVADDYSRRLQVGIDEAAQTVTQKLRKMLLDLTPNNSTLENLSYCQLLNESICEVSEEATVSSGTDLYAIVYNSLASNRSAVVTLPVSSNTTYHVQRVNERIRGDVQEVHSLLIPQLQRSGGKKKFAVTFETGPIPPIGGVIFRISMHKSQARKEDASKTQQFTASMIKRLGGRSIVQVGNSPNDLSVTFDSSTGMIDQISTKDVALNLTQTWGYYTSFDSFFDRKHKNESNQNSGAYIFRPSTPEQEMSRLTPAPNKARFVSTPVGVEVHVSFLNSPWLHQITRVLNGRSHVEIEYTIGPIPIEDGRGKEVVTRFSTPIKSGGVVFTDSNGREFLKRQRDQRPSWNLDVFEPVAGNYYPVNAAIYIEDSEASLAVVVDRSQGGASIEDGSVELMVQRRILADDARGVGEALNETTSGVTAYPPYGKAKRVGTGVIIRVTHLIMIGKGTTGASLARSLMDEAFAKPEVFVGSSPSAIPIPFLQSTFSGLQTALPKNVMLLTFMRLSGDDKPAFLVRLGHQYAVGEDSTLSRPVDVDLSTLLAGYSISSVVEKTLTGNQDWEDYVKRYMDWTGEGNKFTRSESANTTITLCPMEIRTFEIVARVP